MHLSPIAVQAATLLHPLFGTPPQVGISTLFLRHTAQLLDCKDLPLARAQWLFALAARLEKPLHAEHAAAFRGVLRHCAALRAGCGSADDPLLPQLNVLMAVAGTYFGQDAGMAAGIDTIELF